MKFNELIDSLNGAKIEAVLDGCGESATLGLYKVHADDFVENDELPWPDDWPEWVRTEFVRNQGIEVIVA